MSAYASDSPLTDTFRLERFISVLLLDPRSHERFRINPDESMSEAGLTEHEALLITRGTFRQILDAVYKGGAGPAPNPQTDDGGGGGGDGGSGDGGGGG